MGNTGKNTKRKNYGPSYDNREIVSLGPWTSYDYLHNPVHVLFVLSRYKFAARMLTGKKQVLEVGCGDAPGTPIVAQSTGHVTATDYDDEIVAWDKKRLASVSNISFLTLDILSDSPKGPFDGAYSIDVLEHIPKEKTDLYFRNICNAMTSEGTLIVGTPNITSEAYASEQSRLHHINLQSGETLRALMEKYFRTVFMFSMNDEMVHTGFAPMAHYLWGVGVGVL